MGMSLLLLALGLALLYLGGEGLVRGASGLALRCGLTPLAVGLTVVAFGTSAPELVVSSDAAWRGLGDVALGNVIGSNIGNIALILALTALLRPVTTHLQLLRFDVPVMIGAALLLAVLLLDRQVGQVDGLLLLLGIVAYTAWVLRAARKEAQAVQVEFAQGVPHAPRPLWLLLGLTLAGLALLVVGGRVFVDAAVKLAQLWGVSDAVIGLTIVAVGTSLPELAASLVAVLRKESDMAVGNIVGSNIFNVLGILGVSSLVRPLEAINIGVTDLLVMIGLSVSLYPMLVTQHRLTRGEGAVLLGVYAAYVVMLVQR